MEWIVSETLGVMSNMQCIAYYSVSCLDDLGSKFSELQLIQIYDQSQANRDVACRPVPIFCSLDPQLQGVLCSCER